MANVVIPYVSPLLPGEAFACDALHPGLVLCSQNHTIAYWGYMGMMEKKMETAIGYCPVMYHSVLF